MLQRQLRQRLLPALQLFLPRQLLQQLAALLFRPLLERDVRLSRLGSSLCQRSGLLQQYLRAICERTLLLLTPSCLDRRR